MQFLLFSENPEAGEHPVTTFHSVWVSLEVLHCFTKTRNRSLKLSVGRNSGSHGIVCGLPFAVLWMSRPVEQGSYHGNDGDMWWIIIYETLSSFSLYKIPEMDYLSLSFLVSHWQI